MPNQFDSSAVTVPERPNSRMSASPITNGGVMIGRMVRMRSRPLKRMVVRVAISANARPSAVVPMPTSTARNSVFQATPQRRFEVRQSRPQTERSKNFAGKFTERERAGVVPDGAGQDRRDRKEDEDDRERDDAADRGDHEGVAAAPAASREPVAKHHQERRRREAGAGPHAGLARSRRAEDAPRQWQAPALEPDREPLHDDERETRKAAPQSAHAPPARLRAWRSAARSPAAAAAAIGASHHARPVSARPAALRGPSGRVADEQNRCHSPAARCHGNSTKPDPSEREPTPARRGSSRDLRRCVVPMATHFGRFFTSLSHFVSSRRRSAEEPYLAKS